MDLTSDVALGKYLNECKDQALLINHLPYVSAEYNKCHENAQDYVRTHPGSRVVPGWLVEEFEGFTYFNAHSIVRLENGSLADVTPARRHCPFIVHQGTAEEFGRLIQARHRVQYPPVEFNASYCSAPVDDENSW